MTTKTTGGPAFPLPVTAQECHGRFERGYGGMTLRDWFAGMALQGMLANHTKNGFKSDVIKLAYGYADAMLEAREEK